MYKLINIRVYMQCLDDNSVKNILQMSHNECPFLKLVCLEMSLSFYEVTKLTICYLPCPNVYLQYYSVDTRGIHVYLLLKWLKRPSFLEKN